MVALTRQPLSFWSPTPDPFQCELNETKPENYTTFKPHRLFNAEWKVSNHGAATWRRDSIVFYFVSGDKLFDDAERAEGIFLPRTINPDDELSLQAAMTAPSEIGTYSSVWGLRRVNREEPFCTLQIIIRVRE